MKKYILTFCGIIGLILMTTCVMETPEIYGSISGYVKDSDTKEKLANVKVMLQPSGVSQMTGDDGAFSFAELETGTYTVSFTCDSYESYEQIVVVKAGVDASIQVALDPIVPELQVSTNALDFEKEINTLPFDIINRGKGELKWEVKHEVPWIKCTPTSGTITKEKSTVSVTVDRSTLERGAYLGSVVVSSNGGSQTILISCTNDGISLEIEPAELDFGSLTNSLQLTLKNSGKGTVHYSASSANQWLTLSKLEGNVTDIDYLGAVVSRENLSAGDYTSSILLTVDSGSIAIPVKMSVAVNEKPTISVEKPTDIKYNSAILHGTVLSPGSAKITRYGFCWKEGDGTPTIEDNFTNLGDCSSSTAFESYIVNLKAETHYTYRAYAENSVGLSYSEKKETFTTNSLPTIPSVITGNVVEKGSSTAEVKGQITSLGNIDKILHYGHVWSKTDNPTIDACQHTDLGELTQTGTYTSTLTDLDANTPYYYRAYATNEKGTGYGETLILTTTVGSASVVTIEPKNISHNSATVGGEITDTGGNDIVEKGVCWGTSPKPTVDGDHITSSNENKIASNNKIVPKNKIAQKIASIKKQPIPGGTFYCNITGLQKQTTYYTCAYIKTADGTIIYGDDKRFTTTDELKLPTLSDVVVTDIKPSSANLSATIVSNGNIDITACGFCYNMTGTPTIEDTRLECDPSSRTLAKLLSELSQGTTYYVRAYAMNSMGLNYSPSTMSFTTSELTRPQLASVQVDNIGRTTATVSSSIISDGNLSISECGFVWSLVDNPTTTDNMGKFQTSKTNMSVKLTDLQEISTIHVRAYAINEMGAGYSDDLSFQTTNVDIDVWDGSIATKFGGGMSTQSDPILITSAAQFALLAQNVNSGSSYDDAYFRLEVNVNLNNLNWTPIGTGNNKFAGNFDGNGKTINGLKNVSGSGGLFGNNNGTIANLLVYGTSSGGDNVAGIVGTNTGTIMNCNNAVNVTGSGVAGGIVATCKSTGLIADCINQGAINSTGSKVGGICGYCDGGTFTHCVNKVSVVGSDYVGGIAGYYSMTTPNSRERRFFNCVNTATIQATALKNGVGGLFGYMNIQNTNSYSSNETSEIIFYIYNCLNIGNIYNADQQSLSGGLIGQLYMAGCTLTYSHKYYPKSVSLYINNCISESAGMIGKVTKYYNKNTGYSLSLAVTLDYTHCYWLYDIVNNKGREVGVWTDKYIDSWYLHDGSACYLKNTNEDIVTLLNEWVSSNGSIDYKSWRYQTIDGFAVPVFDE